MRETPFRTARRAIEIPIRHFAYFYANEDPQPMRDLAAAIENGDAEKTRELLSESQRNLNQQITEKQLRQATQMQHSQRARAVQELVQNSMDAYGPEGGSMQYRQYEDPKRGRVFEFKDQAGGLSAEDFIGLLMTVGASQKKGNAVGGHGQGFKAMLGVGNVLHATSRNLHGELVQKGHEYVARFNKNEHYVPGLDVMAEGIDGQLDFHQALTGFCSHVEPHFPIMHQTDTPDGMVEKQINQVQRAGNPNFAHIGNVGGIRVYAEPTVSESNHTTWLQKGMLINRMYENQPLNIYLDMPGGSKYLLERGRDVVPESIEKSARKQLKPMIRRYAQRLLEKEHLTPAEISFLRRASPMGQKILKFAAATAGLAAAGYAASWLSLASGAETKLGGLQIDGAQAPPLPHAEMDAPEVPEKPLEFPTTEEGRRGLAMGSLITGLGAGPLYQYLVSRQEQGKSNTFPILVRDAVAALWTKYRGDVPFLIRRMPILPAIEAKKGQISEKKISMVHAQRAYHRGTLTFFSNPEQMDQMTQLDGTFMHADFKEAAGITERQNQRAQTGWNPFKISMAKTEQGLAHFGAKRGRTDGKSRLVRLVQLMGSHIQNIARRPGIQFTRNGPDDRITHTKNVVVNLDHPNIAAMVRRLGAGQIEDEHLVGLAAQVVNAAVESNQPGAEQSSRDLKTQIKSQLFLRFPDIEKQIIRAGIQVVRRKTP